MADMRTRRPILLLTVLTTALIFATASQAGAVDKLPPGLSGANQYTETIPGAGGNESLRQIEAEDKSSAPSKSTAETLGKETAAKLEALGPEGKAAAEAAAYGASPNAGKNGADGSSSKGSKHEEGAAGGSGSNGPGGGSGSGSDSGSSAVGQIVDQVTGTSGSSGMGVLLPLLIICSVVGAVSYAFGRRRTAAHRG